MSQLAWLSVGAKNNENKKELVNDTLPGCFQFLSRDSESCLRVLLRLIDNLIDDNRVVLKILS